MKFWHLPERAGVFCCAHVKAVSAQEARFNAFFRMVDPFGNLFTSNALNNISFYEWVNLADESGNILRTAKALPDNSGLITASLPGVGIIALIWACTAFSRKDIE